MLEPKRTQANAVGLAGTGTVALIPASGDATVYCDLLALVITTPNAAASVITIGDGTSTVFTINYPNAASAPGAPLVIDFAGCPLCQQKPNAAWTVNASVNASGYNILAQYRRS